MSLKMRKFKVEIVTVNPVYMVQLGMPESERQTVEIEGYTLEDAKRRAGIR